MCHERWPLALYAVIKRQHSYTSILKERKCMPISVLLLTDNTVFHYTRGCLEFGIHRRVFYTSFATTQWYFRQPTKATLASNT